MRRSPASSPPVTAALSLPASCWSTTPASLLSSRSSVPPWGTLEPQPPRPAPIDQDVGVEPHDQRGQLGQDAVIDALQLLPSRMLGEPRVGALVGWPRPPRPPWAASGVGCRCAPAGPPVLHTNSAGYPALCHRHHPTPSGLSVRLSSQALAAGLGVAAIRTAPYCRTFSLTTAGCRCLLQEQVDLSQSLLTVVGLTSGQLGGHPGSSRQRLRR